MLDGRGHTKKARQVGGQDPWEVWNSSATDNGGWHAEHTPYLSITRNLSVHRSGEMGVRR